MKKTYFIRIKGHPFVKIGQTGNIPARMSSLQSSIPFQIELVAISKKHEEEEHEIFNEYSHYREWFRLNGELKRFIEDNSESVHPLNFCNKNQIGQYGKFLMSSSSIQESIKSEIANTFNSKYFAGTDILNNPPMERVYNIKNIKFENKGINHGIYSASIMYSKKFHPVRHSAYLIINGKGGLIEIKNIKSTLVGEHVIY